MEQEPSEEEILKIEDNNETEQNNLVIAIIDNNSYKIQTGEVGLSELDLDHPIRLNVSQITDNRSFTTSLERLEELQPKLILVPDSHASRPLCEVLGKRFGNKVQGLTRSFFNETKGGTLMNELSNSQIQTKQHLHSHYLGRAAACAIITYAERTRGNDTIRRLQVSLDPWVEASGRLKMDSSTIKSLELVANRRTGGKEGTLFSVLKTTRTAMGARLLRGQLISPPSSLTTIQSRLDAVEECINNRGSDFDRQEEALSSLHRMADLDRLCSRFSIQPKRFTVRELKCEIEAVLGIRQFAMELNALIGCLEHYQSHFWITIRDGLTQHQEWLNSLCEEINLVTASPIMNSKNDHHLQDIFCVRADQDGMLDTARMAYVQIVTEMENLVEGLKEASGLLKIELKRTVGRGYHLSIPRTEESRLPSNFVQAVRHRKNILCTTPELASLNNRQARVETEVLALTVSRLRPLRALITEHLSQLLQISEIVALTDLILSFAEKSIMSRYTKPIIHAVDNQIKIEKMRHPVVETIVDAYEPRDLFLGHGQRLVIVTGENCAGKTTLLTQTALISIMAQLGCFVPADYCELVLFSKICTRLATDDALDQNASTFSLEMGEAASILESIEQSSSSANKFCLAIIDELGRGTSTRDGLALAASITEYLLKKPAAKVLFSTHFMRLRELSEQYPDRVRISCIQPPTVQEEVDLEKDEYGIRIATTCGMPEDVVEDARNIRKALIEHSKNKLQLENGMLFEENECVLNPVSEIWKVLLAIEMKTRTEDGKRDYSLSKRLLGELKERI